MPRRQLLKADEVFITGTNKGLVPVTQVDDTVIGDKRPGRRTKTVMAALKAHNARQLGEADSGL